MRIISNVKKKASTELYFDLWKFFLFHLHCDLYCSQKIILQQGECGNVILNSRNFIFCCLVLFIQKLDRQKTWNGWITHVTTFEKETWIIFLYFYSKTSIYSNLSTLCRCIIVNIYFSKKERKKDKLEFFEDNSLLLDITSISKNNNKKWDTSHSLTILVITITTYSIQKCYERGEARDF